MACWVCFKGDRSKNRVPFESDAIQGKRTFETVDDIWDELLWFVLEKIPTLEGNISTGQYLWLEQFYDSSYIIESWMFELIDIVNTSIDADIPIASDIQNCPIRSYQYYSIIKNEIAAIRDFNGN